MKKNYLPQLENKKFATGEKLEAEALIVAQKLLYRDGLSFLPDSYIEFLKIYNGIKFDGAYLFGATVDDDLDILDKNLQMKKPEGTVLLGYNDFDLLCFNFKQKKYQIVDRSDHSVTDTYTDDELDYALAKILNV